MIRRPAGWPLAAALLAVAVQGYAGLELRGLFGDGAHFAVRIAADQTFFFHPARWMSQVVSQAPVVAAMRLGVESPHGVGLAFSLSTNLLPGLIILLCWPALAPAERPFFAFPAFAFFAGILGAQFASVTEGLVATACFWLQLCLVAFGTMTAGRAALILLLAAGTFHMHEEMAFLAPVLALACLLRARRESLPGLRGALAAAALLDAVGALAAALMILHPVDATERGWFVDSFLAGGGLHSRRAGWNTPWLPGAAGAVALVALRPRLGRTVRMFGAGALLLAGGAFFVGDLFAPDTQFAARHNGAFVLAAALLLLKARPARPAAPLPAVQAVVALLGLSASLWHVAATLHWNAYRLHYAQVLQSTTGVIPAGRIADRAGPAPQRLAAKLMVTWTNPDFSLAVLPRGCITSIVGNTATVRWQPYDALDLATMPKLRGVTYVYHLPPARHEAACAAR